ncbi:MAG: hypothetical protein KDA44_00475 [Planctomycetales bacterium]|nr:hypothetical protein [Planctomycetales bacterium]
MALYIAVMATALLVTVLGLAGLVAVGIQRRESVELSDRIAARYYSKSAVELALQRIAGDANWRTTYPSGVESAGLTLGDPGGGTVSWIVTDSDGNLDDSDTRLTLRGVGRVGDAVQVSGVEVLVAGTGPVELRSMTSTSSAATGQLLSSQWWCQYVKPTLPETAVSWRVTGVEFYCVESNDKNMSITLYEPVASNWPSGTVIDSLTFKSKVVSNYWSWNSFAFAGTTSMPPDQGVCIALTTTESSAPIQFQYLTGGVAEADSALITGTPAWSAYATNKALR